MDKEQLWKALKEDHSEEAKIERYLIEELELDCDPVVSKLVARNYRRLTNEPPKLS